MKTSVAESTAGGGCELIAGELHRLQVAQQVQGGGDKGDVAGAGAGSAEATTGFDSGKAGACFNAMNTEHRHRQRTGVLSSGGTDESFTVE
jgi:hypothetical protein